MRDHSAARGNQNQQHHHQQQPAQNAQQMALTQTIKSVVLSVLCVLLVANIAVHFLVEPWQSAVANKSSTAMPASSAQSESLSSGSQSPRQKDAAGSTAMSDSQLPPSSPAAVECSIDRRSVKNLSLEEFRSRYRLRRPLLLQFEHGVSDWLLGEAKWSLEQLMRQFGSYEALVGRPIDIVRAGGRGQEKVNFGQFLRSIRNASVNETRYIFSRDFFHSTHMESTLMFPAIMSYNPKDQDLFLFLGGVGSGVAFHKHADAWNAVVSGRKRWLLYPTERAPPGGVHHAFDPRDWLARVYPRIGDQQTSWPIQCVQEAGEILYIPEGFYHATINLEPTLAIGVQNVKPLGNMEATFYDMKGKSPAEVDVIVSKMIKILPYNTELLHKLAVSRKQQEKFQEAEMLLERALSMDPSFLVAILDLAEIKWKYFSKTLEADALFQRALDLNPNHWEVHGKYGEFLTYQTGDLEKAVEVLEQAARLRSDELIIWQLLRTLHDFAGNETGAAQATKRIDQLSIIDDQLIDF